MKFSMPLLISLFCIFQPGFTFAKSSLKATVLNSPVKEKFLKVKLEGEETISKVYFKPKNGGNEVEGEVISEDGALKAKFKVSSIPPGSYEYRLRTISQSGKSDISQASSIVFINFSIDQSLEVADPGEAGKKSLAGVDSDQDGVRDDIQRWINEDYPQSNSIKVNKALKQAAKGLQDSIINSEIKEKALAGLNAFEEGNDCLMGHKGVQNSIHLIKELKNNHLNTLDRTKSYLLSNHHAHGTTTKIPVTQEAMLSFCK